MARRVDLQLYETAKVMAKMQARACVISRITGLSIADTRKIWHDEMGRSSPSGQQPNDDQWFLKSPLRRMHGALILQLYARAQKAMPPHAAFTHAYYHYARLTAGLAPRSTWQGDPAFRQSEDDYVIPFLRAHFLTLLYTDETLSDGQRKCNLQTRRCKSCGTLYLGHVEEVSSKCPICVAQKK
ncbi:FlhC family transcriptional regulator [Verminephrobacter eiseniae]|uniref:Transcriptional activator FlhC n=1 Tax=Verminephrobacter eiseniae (strain EF01-2) TaxID=391735 RepID=A1WPA9_VEREI|nr:FlhC family transcriptional regulator [Verminephrobacter eiseniae]ABM59466.1 hypothetical protein Veis_3754 [Verminephrobacter eiseniae EF01-2]MCW5284989.1 hypothetical protein [Verminephrobacter eiseniae]MCW5302697.1 hypothetical protein [Verminephrobacter eiseniae]MCW8178244.1 hypothetical protein [Verminephrobacter eiseniae]MCW8188974.1 hypothetical protein [Verminephrobacter eiseniae]